MKNYKITDKATKAIIGVVAMTPDQARRAEKDFIVKSFFERLDDHEISKQTGMKYNNIRTNRCRLINKIKKLCKKESEEKING